MVKVEFEDLKPGMIFLDTAFSGRFIDIVDRIELFQPSKLYRKVIVFRVEKKSLTVGLKKIGNQLNYESLSKTNTIL